MRKKNAKKMKETSASKAKLRVTESWDENREENLTECGLMEHTNERVENVNREGLFEVKDSFYMFIREVEILGRDCLNKEQLRVYQEEDLRTALIKSGKPDIVWSSLTHYIENFELKDFLKKEV